MRSEGKEGRHWMDRRTLGNRASFHLEKTGRKTKTGVGILKAYLRITEVNYYNVFDPRGRPIVVASSDHNFHTWYLHVRSSPLFKSHNSK